MSAPTKLISQPLVDDLSSALARLHLARKVYPKHEEPTGRMNPHVECEVCTATARLDYLIDTHLLKLFPQKETRTR
jgi:hypothetical protein